MAYSGNIQANSQINFALYTQTLSSFQSYEKSPSTIYFIVEDRTLYLDGVYYGVNQSDLRNLTSRLETAETTIGTHTTAINALTSIIAQPIQVKKNGTDINGNDKYDYTTIGPALKYLDETLAAVQAQAGTGTVASQIQTAIFTFEASLDSTVRGNLNDADDTIETGHKVGVKIVEIDGKLNSVTVVENDIASASALSNAQTAINTLNGSDSTTGSVAKAVKDAKDELKGTKKEGDTTAETIRGAKDYADAAANAAASAAQTAAINKVNELAGTNWTAAAGTVKNIIDELTADGNTATDAMITVADKLRGDFTVGTGGSQTTDVKSYVDDKFTTATGSASTAESNAKSYADGLVNGLDKTVTDNYTAASGNNEAAPASGHVGVQIVQEDGKLKSVDIVESDIASAATLSSVSSVANTANTNASTALSHLTWTIL